MKKLATLLLALAMVLTLSVSTVALDSPNPDITGGVLKKGTPVVDGEIDSIYYGATAIKWNDPNWGSTSSKNLWNNSASATVYMMYDDSNVYLIADIKDDNVVTIGEDLINNPDYEQYGNPIYNDCFEFRLSFDGTRETVKFAIDAYGYLMFGLSQHYDRFDYSTVKYKTKLTSGGYRIELSVPCTKGKFDMIEAGKLGIAIEFNDLDDLDADEVEATGIIHYANQSVAYNCPIFYTLSNEKAVAGSAPSGNDTPITPVVTTAPPVVSTEDTTTADVEDTTVADVDVDGTTAAEVDDTTAAEGDDTTAAEGDDTTAAEGDDTTATEGDDTTAAEVDDTTAAEGDDTTAAEGDDTTAADTTGEDDKSSFPVVPVVIIVAAVVVIAVIAAIVAKSKKK